MPESNIIPFPGGAIQRAECKTTGVQYVASVGSIFYQDYDRDDIPSFDSMVAVGFSGQLAPIFPPDRKTLRRYQRKQADFFDWLDAQTTGVCPVFVILLDPDAAIYWIGYPDNDVGQRFRDELYEHARWSKLCGSSLAE